MRKHKASYIYNISKDSFVVYRLSHYSKLPMKAVAAGIAYTDGGDYSSQFLKVLKRYNINVNDDRYCFMCNTKEEIALSLYLNQKVTAEKYKLPENQVPKSVVEFGERELSHIRNKNNNKAMDFVDVILDDLGDRLSDKKEAREFICQKYKGMIGVFLK